MNKWLLRKKKSNKKNAMQKKLGSESNLRKTRFGDIRCQVMESVIMVRWVPLHHWAHSLMGVVLASCHHNWVGLTVHRLLHYISFTPLGEVTRGTRVAENSSPTMVRIPVERRSISFDDKAPSLEIGQRRPIRRYRQSIGSMLIRC